MLHSVMPRQMLAFLHELIHFSTELVQSQQNLRLCQASLQQKQENLMGGNKINQILLVKKKFQYVPMLRVRKHGSQSSVHKTRVLSAAHLSVSSSAACVSG